MAKAVRDIISESILAQIEGEYLAEKKKQEKAEALRKRKEKLSDFIAKFTSIFSAKDAYVLEEVQHKLIAQWLAFKESKEVSLAIIQIEPYMKSCSSDTLERWENVKIEFSHQKK